MRWPLPRSRQGVRLSSSSLPSVATCCLGYAQLLAEQRALPSLPLEDTAHCLVTSVGLTHLGSAAMRDAMHQNLQQQTDAGTLSDSMKMLQWGVAGSIPVDGQPGAQPEWFYKGDGSIVMSLGPTLPLR